MVRRLALVLAFGVAVGCGPVAYVDQVTLRADDAVASARAARADTYSPYYWTRATEYLQMAREVAAHADFQGANRFGRLAEEAAIKAQAEAEAAPKTVTPAPQATPAVPVATPAAAPAAPAPAKGHAP